VLKEFKVYQEQQVRLEQMEQTEPQVLQVLKV
jgi:hypothetical protein